mgnify:FL=1
MIRRWIILGITMLAVLPLWAQKGMHVEALFDSRFKQDKRAVEVLIKGKELKKISSDPFPQPDSNRRSDTIQRNRGTRQSGCRNSCR